MDDKDWAKWKWIPSSVPSAATSRASSRSSQGGGKKESKGKGRGKAKEGQHKVFCCAAYLKDGKCDGKDDGTCKKPHITKEKLREKLKELKAKKASD